MSTRYTRTSKCVCVCLTGAGQPLSVGTKLDRRNSFCVSSQRELYCVVWFGWVRLEENTETDHTLMLSNYFVCHTLTLSAQLNVGNGT